MAVCEAKNCKKRELCMQYVDNYFKYNPTSDWKQLIDWSRHGSVEYYRGKDGKNYISHTYDCGDDSITYPMFEQIEIEEEVKDHEE